MVIITEQLKKIYSNEDLIRLTEQQAGLNFKELFNIEQQKEILNLMDSINLKIEDSK